MLLLWIHFYGFLSSYRVPVSSSNLLHTFFHLLHEYYTYFLQHILLINIISSQFSYVLSYKDMVYYEWLLLAFKLIVSHAINLKAQYGSVIWYHSNGFNFDFNWYLAKK